MKNYYKLLSKRLTFMYVIYILLFTIAAYSACIFYVKNNYKAVEQKRAEQLIYNLESFLSYGTDITYTLSSNPVVVQYAQNKTPNNEILAELQKEFTNWEYVNKSYKSIAIVNLPTNQVMSAAGSVSLDFFIKTNGVKDNSFKDTLYKLYERNANNVILTTVGNSADNNSVTSIATCISCETNGENPVVFVLFCELEELFKDIPKSSLPCAIEINLKKDNIKLLYDETNHYRITTDDADILSYKNIVTASNYSRFWKEMSCSIYVPYFSYLMHLNSFFMLLMMLLIALLFIGILSAKNSANIMYTPIKKLLSVLPHDISNNNASEFDAFEKYVFSLESQKNLMSEIISENKIELSDKFLIQLMTSTISKTQIKSGVVNYGLTNIKFPVVTFIITYRNYQDIKDILSGDGLNEVRLSIHEYFAQSFSSQKFFKLIDIDQQCIAGITSISNFDNFSKQLKKAALGIEMMLDIDIVVFTGKKAMSWYEISDSYFSANNIKNKYMIVSDRNIVISAEDVNDTEFNKIINYSTESESFLINSVMNGNKSAITDYIGKIVDANMDNKILSREHYSQFVIMLYSTITKLLTAINKTEKEVFGSVSIYLELMSCNDISTLKSKLSDFIFTIISNIESMQKNIEDNTTKLMLNYVHNNFAQDISLFTLADYLNVSHPYASKIFKSNTGQNFKDYLADYRLTKAVELMENNPHMKLSDVAKQVGYSGHSFTRVFTKKYGVPPSSYNQRTTN